MLSSANFVRQQAFALLLIGPPFSGKTNVALQFPKPYFLDADDKLANAVQRHPDKQFNYDCPLRRPSLDGKSMVPVEAAQRWAYATECLKAAAMSPEIGTIVIDSASAMSDMLIEHILQYPSTAKSSLQVGGIKVMDQSMWLPFKDLWKRLIMGMRSSGKLLVVVCHEEVDKDETTGAIYYRPLIPGQLKTNFASMFTDVWRCETPNVLIDPAKGQMGVKYVVRTQPTPRMSLGNSLGLPAEFEFNIEQFSAKLEAARTGNLVLT